MRPRAPWRWLLLAALAVPLLALAQLVPPAPAEPITPIPLQGDTDPARARLGERLFGDPRLSGDHSRSCASCHPLDRGGMDGRARGAASANLRVLRNVPTIFNVALNLFYNWDGAFETLAALDEKVLLDPALMGNAWPTLLATLEADPSYRAQFDAAYPGQGMDRTSVLDALEQFERSLLTPNSRFDRYLRGEPGALSADELRGYAMFKAYGCVACHQGVNVGGNLFQKIGIFHAVVSGDGADGGPDPGRYNVTRDPRDHGVYRVPSLRNVAVTGPYFHDGHATTLEKAVEAMARGQLDRTLSAEEKRLIAGFLATLTGEFRGKPLASSAPGDR